MGTASAAAPAPPPAPHRPIRAVLVASVRLAMCVVVLLAAYVLYANHRLSASADAIRAGGEPLASADFLPGPISDTDNAAVSILAAADWLDRVAEPNPRGMTRRNLLQLRSSVDLYGTVVDGARKLVRRAKTQRLAEWRHASKGSTTYPARQKQLVQILELAVLEDVHRGHEAEAVETVQDLLRIADAMEYADFGFSEHLAASEVRRSAITSCQAFLFNVDLRPDTANADADGRPSRQQMRQLLAALRDERCNIDGLVRAFQLERAHVVRTAAGIGTPTLPGWIARTPTARLDAARIADAYSNTIAALRESRPRAAVLSALPAHPPSRTAVGTYVHQFQYLMDRRFERNVDNHYKVLTDVRAMTVCLAIEWYRFDHEGNFPESLAALVPDYLPTLPSDPSSTGTSFGYRIVPQAMVYSLDSTDVDAGGNIRSSTASPFDRVWPLQKVNQSR